MGAKKALIASLITLVAYNPAAAQSGFFSGGFADGVARSRELDILEQDLRLQRQMIELEQQRSLRRQLEFEEIERLRYENRRLQEQLARENEARKKSPKPHRPQ